MRSFLWVGAVLALAGCAVPQQQGQGVSGPAGMSLEKVAFDQLPGWSADHVARALPAFRAGCAEMKSPAGASGSLGGAGEAAAKGGQPAQWQAACDAAAGVPAGDEAAARQFFEQFFQPYAVAENGSAEGLFTGYYEPEVHGSRTPEHGYPVPLYRLPPDLVTVDLSLFPGALAKGTLSGPVQAGQLIPAPPAPDPAPVSRGIARLPVPQVTVDLSLFPEAAKTNHVIGRVRDGKLVPYYDRAAIMEGALAHKRLELLWVDNAIDAFFLEVQGAGRVVLPDHHVVRVAYAGQNGLPYKAIGRVLADRGAMTLDQVTMQSIRAWMEAHPGEATEVMNQNPSYVFFREVDGVGPDQGPPGAMGGLALTPGRSIAVDRGYLPLGAPVWVDTTDPVDGAPLQRLMLAQDLGGAIRGAVRADIFFGWGPEAEARAGRMRQKGRQYVLLPKA